MPKILIVLVTATASLALIQMLRGPAFAVTVLSTWNGGSGDWDLASNWTPTGIPNNGGGNTYEVTIDGKPAVSSNVTLDVPVTIDGLTVNTGDMLSIEGAGILQLEDRTALNGVDIVTNGTVLVTDGTSIKIAGQRATINQLNIIGNGVLQLQNGNIQSASDNRVEMNNFSTLIGEGLIGVMADPDSWVTVNNDGLIQATGVLEINGPFTVSARGRNTGTMEAIHGDGELALRANILNRDGTIRVGGGGEILLGQNTIIEDGILEVLNQGLLRLEAATFKPGVNGGRLTNFSGGTMRVLDANEFTLGARFINSLGGHFVVNKSATLVLRELTGSIVNDGTIQLDSATVRLADDTIQFDGSGSLTLSLTLPGVSSTIVGESTVSHSLINGINHAINGAGIIRVNLDNRGAISADLSGQTLELNPVGCAACTNYQNSGILSAESGGILVLSRQLSNNGGLIRAHDAVVRFSPSSQTTGGVLEVVGAGEIQIQSGASVNLVELLNSNAGMIDVTSSSLSANVITNPSGGHIVLNNVTLSEFGTVANGGVITLQGSTLASFGTLSGGGTVELSGAGSKTIGVNQDNVIAGTGPIFVDTNRGDIVANGTAPLEAYVDINSGLLTATENATLVLKEFTQVTNHEGSTSGTIRADGGLVEIRGNVAGGNIEVNNLSELRLYGSLSGGARLSAADGGLVRIPANVTVVAQANMTISPQGQLLVATNASLSLPSGGTYTNHGSWILQSGADLNVNGALLTNTGDISVVNAGVVGLRVNSFANSGTLTVNGGTNIFAAGTGSVMTLSGGGEIIVNAVINMESNIRSDNIIRGTGGLSTQEFVNDGYLIAEGAGQTLFFDTDRFTNQGTIQVNSGSELVLSNFDGVQAFTNLNNGTLTEGTYLLTGVLDLQMEGIGDIVTNAATIVLTGPGAQFVSGGNNLLDHLVTNTASGDFTIQSGRNLGVSSFANAGSMKIGSGSRLTVGTGGYAQSAGETNVQGKLQVDGNLTLNGGVLSSGAGVIGATTSNLAGAVVVSDSISPPSTVTVAGNTTLWTVASGLYVGGNESGPGAVGTLSVTNSGEVRVGGTLKLYSTGLILLNGGTLRTRSLSHINGGALDFRDGTLEIDGGTFDIGGANFGFQGNPAGKTATFRLTNGAIGASAELRVGSFGNIGSGRFELLNGSTFSSTLARIAREGNSAGSALVDGAGSVWTTGEMRLGESGVGSLTVQNGGTVTTTGAARIGLFENSSGSALVDGAGSVWTTGVMRVGESGVGSLTVQNGGDVNVTNTNVTSLHVGRNATATGTLLVTGTGSTLTTATGGDLYIGGSSGTLTVADGAVVDIADLTTIDANGRLNMRGGTYRTGSFAHTSTGTLDFDDGTLEIDGGTFNNGSTSFVYNGAVSGDTATFRLINGATGTVTNFEVGQLGLGSGEFELLSGSDFTATGISRIGRNTGSSGSVLVSGAGSVWNTASILVSDNGTGSVIVENGGTVSSSNNVDIGRNGVGTATIVGNGSNWSVTGITRIGRNGTGVGSLLVDGTGAELEAIGDLRVGENGVGSLTVQNGGTVSATGSLVTIAHNAIATGTLLVTGDGSSFTTTTGDLYIGNNLGNGTLTVANGGLVDVADLTNLSNNGRLNLHGGTLRTSHFAHTSTGALEVELDDMSAGEFDGLLNVTGNAALGGALDVTLVDGFTPSPGQSWEIIDVVGTRSGTFAGLTEGAPIANYSGTILSITYSGGDGNDVVLYAAAGLTGDYNASGTVDTADYVVWRKNNNTAVTLPNDSTPGTSQVDYDVWRANFGKTGGSGASASAGSSRALVPEPAALLMILMGMTAMFIRQRRAVS